MKKSVYFLSMVLLFITTPFCYAQVSIDVFKIPVAPEGEITGNHFYMKETEGPLVLFSGSFNSTQEKYRGIATKLASSGFHVVTYDLRGHGKSSATLLEETSDNPTPIHNQETHDAIEKYHPLDLEEIYTYAQPLNGVLEGQTILSLEGGTMGWSFDMITNHSELTKFVLLTSFFGSKGKEHFNNNTDFDILAVQSQKHPQFAGWTKEFFEQNQNHNIQEIECHDGWGYLVTEKCPAFENQIIDWIKRISKKG